MTNVHFLYFFFISSAILKQPAAPLSNLPNKKKANQLHNTRDIYIKQHLTGACQVGCTRFENCEKFSTKRRKRRPSEQTRQQPLNALQVVAELMRKQFSSGFPRTKGRKEKKRMKEEKRREKKRREKRAHCVSICTCLVKRNSSIITGFSFHTSLFTSLHPNQSAAV